MAYLKKLTNKVVLLWTNEYSDIQYIYGGHIYNSVDVEDTSQEGIEACLNEILTVPVEVSISTGLFTAVTIRWNSHEVIVFNPDKEAVAVLKGE